LSGFISYQLRRADTLFAIDWRIAFRAAGFPLTPVQGAILMMIDENRGLTQTALARMLNVEGPTLLQSLDRLEQHGYVRRTRRANDRRAYILQVTAEGQIALAAVRRLVPSREAELLGDLAPAERQLLLALLTRLVRHAEGVVSTLQPRDKPRG
jgi:MarR family transcriptional regulator, transcriptional regulator for hemolysin